MKSIYQDVREAHGKRHGSKKFRRGALASAILFLFPTIASAATYYVSTAGSDANSGLSSTAPWKTFAKVSSSTFAPGDQILLRRGDTWSEQLTIPSSGNASAQIVFSNYGTGVNPVIDGNYAIDKCISTIGKSYITIDGVDCKRAKMIGIGASTSPGTNIIIKNLTISDIGNDNAERIGIYQQGGYLTVDNCTVTRIAQAGIMFGGSHNTITNNRISYTNLYSTAWGAGINGTSSFDDISYNTVDHCGGVGEFGKTHGIYVSLSETSHVHHNTITNSTTGGGIKSVGSGNFHHNYISGSSHSGIMAGTNGSSKTAVVNIYNNIFTGNRQGVSETDQGTGSFTLNIYNNTFYSNNNTLADSYYAELVIEQNVSTSLVIKNNILFGAGRFTYAFNVPQSHAEIDNNCVYQATGSLIYYGGSTKTWSAWQSLGFDIHGVNANPKLTNPTADFRLQSTSPAINAGVDVGLTKDFYGNPIVGLPDIGAIESGSVVAPSPTPTPTPTLTVAPSPTPSPTVSPKPSPTPSPTVSPAPSPTVSPRPSPTPSPTVSPKPSPTPSPTPTATVPGAPTSVKAVAGNASASVSFVAPVSNGGSAITGYTVTSIPAGGVDALAGTTSLTRTLTGLVNGTSYTFTVKATNAVGTSVASAPSNAVIPKRKLRRR